jgi:hypothetical protein
LGSLVASDDTRSLEEEITAEAVAWVCIAVYLPLMTLSLDPLGFKTQRDLLHHRQHQVPASPLLCPMARSCRSDQEETVCFGRTPEACGNRTVTP